MRLSDVHAQAEATIGRGAVVEETQALKRSCDAEIEHFQMREEIGQLQPGRHFAAAAVCAAKP